MEISCTMLSSILNIIGISFDMVGAILVAIVVVDKFNGDKFLRNVIENPMKKYINEEEGDAVIADTFGKPMMVTKAKPIETEKFKEWQSKTYTKMKVVLFFLLLGFLIQIISNIISLTI